MARRPARRQKPGSLGKAPVVLPITLPAETYAAVERLAAQLHRSKAQLCREALDLFLATHTKRSK